MTACPIAAAITVRSSSPRLLAYGVQITSTLQHHQAIDSSSSGKFHETTMQARDHPSMFLRLTDNGVCSGTPTSGGVGVRRSQADNAEFIFSGLLLLTEAPRASRLLIKNTPFGPHRLHQTAHYLVMNTALGIETRGNTAWLPLPLPKGKGTREKTGDSLRWRSGGSGPGRMGVRAWWNSGMWTKRGCTARHRLAFRGAAWWIWACWKKFGTRLRAQRNSVP